VHDLLHVRLPPVIGRHSRLMHLLMHKHEWTLSQYNSRVKDRGTPHLRLLRLEKEKLPEHGEGGVRREAQTCTQRVRGTPAASALSEA
jgi:hypothetical protein